ncbi:MAG: hypothetical protein K6E92_05765 [Lachnospiraceae bacterium]|nr:hypothetical protein [Lachnospiraceae bacterium]
MKAYFGKILRLCTLALLMLLFTACGGKLTTELTVDETLSGTRVMVYSANLAENRGRYHGDVQSAAETVSENLPAGLEFEDRSTKEDVIFVFTIRFDSLEEYSDKVASILSAGGHAPDSEPVSYRTADSVFSSGIYYTEHFGALELMDWLPQLFVKKGIVDAGDQSKVFYDNAETYHVAGYETGGSYPYIDTLVYLTIDGVDFYTAFGGDGSVSRTIVVTLPQSSMDLNEAKIREFLSVNEAEGAKGSWSKEEGKQIYTLTRTGMDPEALTGMMQRFYGNREGAFALEDAQSQGNGSFFADNRRIRETIDLGEYETGAAGSVNFHYYVSDNGTYTGTYREYDFDNNIYGYASEKEGYQLLFYTGSARVRADYTYRYSYRLGSAEVVLDVSDAGRIRRNVRLLYEEKLDPVQAANLKGRLEVAFAREDGGITLEACGQTKAGFEVVLRTEGDTPGRESALWNRVFGCAQDLTVTRSGRAPLSLRKLVHVEDRFTLAPFASMEVPSVTYTVKGIGTVLGEDPASYGAVQKGADLVYTLSGMDPGSPMMQSGITGERRGLPGYLAWIAVILSGVTGIILAVVYAVKEAGLPADADAPEDGSGEKGKTRKKKRAKEDAPKEEAGRAETLPAHTLPAEELPELYMPVPESSEGGSMGGFCEYCGKPLKDGVCDCAEFQAAAAERKKSAATQAQNAAATMTEETGTALLNSVSGASGETVTAVNNAVASGQLPGEEESSAQEGPSEEES